MTLRQAIYTTLSAGTDLAALVSARIYPDCAPPGTVQPYCVFSLISAAPEHYQGGDSGLQHDRVQIDCYAQTTASADAVAAAVKTAMAATVEADTGIVHASQDNALDLAEQMDDASGQPAYRAMLDYRVWYRG